jgi:hypothetical protein
VAVAAAAVLRSLALCSLTTKALPSSCRGGMNVYDSVNREHLSTQYLYKGDSPGSTRPATLAQLVIVENDVCRPATSQRRENGTACRLEMGSLTTTGKGEGEWTIATV